VPKDHIQDMNRILRSDIGHTT